NWGLKHVRLADRCIPASENNRSLGTDVAGTDKYFFAKRRRIGKYVRSCHHPKGSQFFFQPLASYTKLLHLRESLLSHHNQQIYLQEDLIRQMFESAEVLLLH